MNDATATKVKRERAFIRAFDYANGTGTVKDAASGTPIVEFDLSTFPQSVRDKLALSGLMALVSKAGVEANSDGEDPSEAMNATLSALGEDTLEFKDGMGVAMGGALKRVARAVVELDFSHVKAPNGSTISWTKGDITSAYAAMKELWALPASAEGVAPAYESGKARFNRIKSNPAVAAKLLTYQKKAVETGLG
jgi:hypothetical protein